MSEYTDLSDLQLGQKRTLLLHAIHEGGPEIRDAENDRLELREVEAEIERRGELSDEPPAEQTTLSSVSGPDIAGR